MNIYASLTDPHVISLLQGGAVGVLPSDTVYGLMCLARNQAAVVKLYQLKKREHKPGTIIAASVDQLVELGLKRRYLVPVESYWPGPISVIIPCADPALAYVHQGLQSLAVRIPKDPALLKLLQQTGPLLTSSANPPGTPPAATASEASSFFSDSVDFYVTNGDLSKNLPSTIVRIVDDAIEVIRQGAVTIQAD